MTTTIDATTDLVTLINVFTVEPARQDELVDVLNEATRAVMRHRPGFVSANIHRSLDGHQVANYAQWRRRTDFDAMLADPDCRQHMDRCRDLATSAPALYEVVTTH